MTNGIDVNFKGSFFFHGYKEVSRVHCSFSYSKQSLLKEKLVFYPPLLPVNHRKQPPLVDIFRSKSNVMINYCYQTKCHHSMQGEEEDQEQEEEEEAFESFPDKGNPLHFESMGEIHIPRNLWMVHRKKTIRFEMSDWRKSLRNAWESYKHSGDHSHFFISSFGFILWLRKINYRVLEYNNSYNTCGISAQWMMSGLKWEKELGRLEEQKCDFENFPRKDKPLIRWLIDPVSLDDPDYGRQKELHVISKSAIPSEWYDFDDELYFKKSEWRRSLVKAWESKCSEDDSKWVESSEALKLQLQEINNKVLEYNRFVPSYWPRMIGLEPWERELTRVQRLQKPSDSPGYDDDDDYDQQESALPPKWYDLKNELYFKGSEWRRSLVKAWESKCSGDHSKWVESSEALKLQLQEINNKALKYNLLAPFKWEQELAFAQYCYLENLERERLKFKEDALHRDIICVDLKKEIKSKISKWRISLKKAFASKCEGDRSKWFINSLALQFQLEEINNKIFLHNLIVLSDRQIFVRNDWQLCGLNWEEELCYLEEQICDF